MNQCSGVFEAIRQYEVSHHDMTPYLRDALGDLVLRDLLRQRIHAIGEVLGCRTSVRDVVLDADIDMIRIHNMANEQVNGFGVWVWVLGI